MKLGWGAVPSGNNTPPDGENKTRPSRLERKLGKLRRKREASYEVAHDQLADAITVRNKTQGSLIEKGIHKGTQSEALEQVGLSQAKNFTENHSLSNGFVDGYSAGKATSQGLTPEQYAKPGPKANLTAGAQVLGMTPDVIHGVHAQQRVTQKATHFEGKRQHLHDTRLTELTAQEGLLRKQKKGKIVSGSYQASSPEELAASLKHTQPASNIREQDIQPYLPSEAGLLPPNGPAHLKPKPATKPADSKPTQPALSPRQAVEESLLQRDNTISQLDRSLRQKDSPGLERAIQNRDYHQMQTGGDLARGLAATPRESAILGLNYLYQYVPKGPGATPLFSAKTIQQAESSVGYSVGQQMAGSQSAKPMLRHQVEVEKLHAEGKPIATELRDLHKQKAMETDRNLLIDQEGDSFYDAFETPLQAGMAETRYNAMAREQLPRPTDQLYLDDAVTRLVPNQPRELIRRPLNGWFNPPPTNAG